MVSRGLSTWALLSGAASALPGCASQHDTAQALTIAGAAAVVLGASMAANEQCYDAAAGEGGLQAYCAPGLSKGARTAGKGLAAAGVGLAAAGYALTPKGPDQWQRPPADPDAIPLSPYRLVRREPAPEQPEVQLAPPPAAAVTPEAASQSPGCAPAGSSAAESSPAPNCSAAAPEAASQPEGSSRGAAPDAPGLAPHPAPGAPR
jgi:hypothetical protein